MAMASARFYCLFPLLLNSRSSSLLLFRRFNLATRHFRHLNGIPHSLFHPPLRSGSFHHQSSLQAHPVESEQQPYGVWNSSHPWPEWMHFVNWVSTSGFCNGSLDDAQEFVEQDLSLDFLRTANACLDFAQNHPNLLWSLPRGDVEVAVHFGSPFLFKDALGATRRMKCFLGAVLNDVLESDKPSTVDLMRFLLSYAHMAFFSSENKPINSKVESSVRKLLGELVNTRGMYADSCSSVQNQFAEKHGQEPKSLGKDVQMQRGDWLCPRCSFMNFSKNFKCRECEESRPEKHLTGREWECPRCNFINFGRNAVCLRCDCNKAELNPSRSPSHVLLAKNNIEIKPSESVHKERIYKVTELEKSSGKTNSIEVSEYLDEILGQRSATDMYSIDTGLNDASTLVHEERGPEKSERLFRKVSEPNDGDDKDFPETMPMRKGENRFVVSKKKDRSLTSPMYKRHMAMEQKPGNTNKYVPFVPFPPDYFSKEEDKPKPEDKEGLDSRASLPDHNSTMSNSGMAETQKFSDLGNRRKNDSVGKERKSLEGSAVKEPDPLDMSEEAKAERWFRRVAQIKDISELSQIPDEDFPSIMPMRKGMNRFVVSKRKTPLERRLTSPQYGRNIPVVNSDIVKKETDS